MPEEEKNAAGARIRKLTWRRQKCGPKIITWGQFMPAACGAAANLGVGHGACQVCFTLASHPPVSC